MRFRYALLLLILASAPAVSAPRTEADRPAQLHYLRALVHENQGNLAMAKAEIDKAIAVEPGSAHLHRTNAELAFRLGLFEESVAAIERALELDPDNHRLYITAGQIHWARGDADKAEEKLKRAVELAPDESEPLVNLATAVTARDPKKAVQLYRDYLERHPADVDIWERLARIHQGMGEVEKAKTAWKEALKYDPGSLEARLATAQIAEVQYDTATAIANYEAILEQEPNNLPLLLRIGELRYRNNDMAKAYEAFSQAKSIAPESAAANFWLALLAEQQGDWGEAIELLKPVAAKQFDAGVYLRLSYYYSQAGRHREAIGVLKELSEAEPENTDFLNYLAIAYEQDGQFANARNVLERLVDLDPENADHRFHLATVYDRMNKFPKAEEQLRDAIRLRPEFHMALNYLGYSYADRNVNLEEAERLLVEAVALDPGNAAYMDSLGWVYHRMGKTKRAEALLQEAALLANDALVWDHLGEARDAAGNRIGAILAYDESLRLDADQPRLRKSVRRMASRLGARDKAELSVRRNLRALEGLRQVNGMVEVTVCEKRPCFDSRAQLSYQKNREFRIEIPGPLSGPAMLLVKPAGQPARYGAIHPVFQSVEYYVTRAFERFAGVFSATLLSEADVAVLRESARESRGRVQARWGGAVYTFRMPQSELTKVEWDDDAGADELRLSGWSGFVPTGLPSAFEWIDRKSGFEIRLKLVEPVVRGGDAADRSSP